MMLYTGDSSSSEVHGKEAIEITDGKAKESDRGKKRSREGKSAEQDLKRAKKTKKGMHVTLYLAIRRKYFYTYMQESKERPN